MLAALFADNINLVDYIRGVNVIHTDEPDSPQLQEESFSFLSSYGGYFHLEQLPAASRKNLSKPLYDQDSPFLEATTWKKFTVFLFDTEEHKETIHSFFLIRQLYIHQCSLLI